MLILIGAPIMILVSILIDFVTLPKICWKNEENFEEKYQKNSDEPNDSQLLVIGTMFQNTLFKKWDYFQGKFVSYLELCGMHK